jgi:hypothetical protein
MRAAAPLLLALLLLGARARADVIEPPADVPEGADHAEATDDSLSGAEVELGLGLSGDAHSTERRRRVSFSGNDLSGTVREGRGDPLAGGSVIERGGWGELRAGKLSPRWNRGLLLGSSCLPWERAALESAGRGGRSGEGAELKLAGGGEVLLGRFSGRELAGAKLECGLASLGVLATGREQQASLGLAGEGEVLELAMSRSGLWRAEGLWSGGEDRARWTAAVRQGSAGFRSIAEPRRAGPARSVTIGTTRRARRTTTRLLASVWRFRPARAGARTAIEVERTLQGSQRLVAGLEEQQGYRGELRTTTGLRQGGWIEWSRPARPLGLLVRHELWGARPALREVTRAVSSCRIEARLPHDISLSLATIVFRVRRGESLYLREAESDRLVLRALSGAGQRTQLDLRLPFARGALRAGAQLTAPLTGQRVPRWTLEWTRRSGTRPRRGEGSSLEPDP